MSREGGLADLAALAHIAVYALLLLGLQRVQAHLAGPYEELAESAYWRSRHAAAELWKSRIPGKSDSTMLAVSGEPTRFWDLWGAHYNCPFTRERIGNVGDGGKWVCGVSSLLQHPGCLVFSIGSNGEPSFEQAILNSTPCEVHTWDHTLDDEKIQAVRKVPGINLHLLGVGSEAAAAHDNFTSLSKMLAGVQQEYIDVLKMDVEGGEWQILEDWYKSGRGSLPVSQLIIEFHSDFAVNGLEGTVAPVFELLALDGFRVFAVEPNYYCLGGACAATYVEYSFIKVSKHGRVYSHSTKTHASSLKHQSDV